MTYQDFFDLDAAGGEDLNRALSAIIDDLRQHTKPPPHTSGGRIQTLTPMGWIEVRM